MADIPIIEREDIGREGRYRSRRIALEAYLDDHLDVVRFRAETIAERATVRRAGYDFAARAGVTVTCRYVPPDLVEVRVVKETS